MSFIENRLFGRQQTASNTLGSEDILPESTDERRSNIIKLWTYYNGRDATTGKSQWSYLYERFETLPKREIEDIENHTRICTDRLRRLMVNSWRGFEFDDEQTGNSVMEVFERNSWPHLLNLISLYGKVTGDAFIKLVPMPSDSQFGPIRLILLDTESVEIDVSPHDRNNVRYITVSYDFFQNDGNASHGLTRHSYKEIIDKRLCESKIFKNSDYFIQRI